MGAIYYVMAKDWKQEWAAEAEADTYYLFSTLLAEMRDVFISDMDDADTGIQGRLAHMQTLLQLHDPEVKEHLDEVGVDVSYYAVRWWTCLASKCCRPLCTRREGECLCVHFSRSYLFARLPQVENFYCLIPFAYGTVCLPVPTRIISCDTYASQWYSLSVIVCSKESFPTA